MVKLGKTAYIKVCSKISFSNGEESAVSNVNVSLQISHNSNVNLNSFYTESNTKKRTTQFQTSNIEVYFHEWNFTINLIYFILNQKL